MSLPEGVTTCTVVAGVPVTHTGAGVKTFVSIEPSVFLVHAATGTPLVDFVEELNISEGVAGQFTLPHTDQAGFQDENGNAYTNWYYTARVTYSTPSKAKNKTPKVKVFQLTTGQSTVDLDLLPSGAPALPYIAPSATVSAFGGRTGAVTLQESDLPGRLSDASLSATIDSQVAAAVAPKLDKTEAAATYSTPTAVTAQVPPLVAAAISADPTVANAAAAAVTANVQGRSLLETTDIRVPQVGASKDEDVLFAVRDADNNMTWLAARRSDGAPTDWARDRMGDRLGVSLTSAPDYLFAFADADKNLTDLTVRKTDGQLAQFVIDRLKPRILEGFTAPPAAAVAPRRYADTKYVFGSDIYPITPRLNHWMGWGSSSMYGFRLQLADLGVGYGAPNYYQGGKGGERADQIAARMGSVPMLVTVVGGSVPATTDPVNITTSNVGVTSQLLVYPGTLGGVPGWVEYSSTTAGYTFRRTTAGASTPVPADTPFIPDVSTWRDAVTFLWMGKNDTETGSTTYVLDRVVKLTDASFDWLAPLHKRCVVMGHFVNTNIPAVHPQREQVLAINAAHQKAYGNLYFDVQNYLTGTQVWTDTGITPTQTDYDQQALGNKPPSLSADDGHLNDAGYLAVRNRLQNHITAVLGWY